MRLFVALVRDELKLKYAGNIILTHGPGRRTEPAEKDRRWTHWFWAIQEPQVFSVYFAQKISQIFVVAIFLPRLFCANIYGNIHGAKKQCKKQRKQLCVAYISANFSANICGAKNTQNIYNIFCGNYCAAQILPQKRKYLRIANKTAKKRK